MDHSVKTREELIEELKEITEAINILKKDYNDEVLLFKKAEEKVRRSEELFRKAFLISPDSVNINRLSDGMYVSINEGFTRIMGFSEEDVMGKTSLELNIWVKSEDRVRLVNEIRKNGRVENYEADFRKKDGSIINGLMSAEVIDIDGIPHLLNITKDNTVSKRVQKELEQERSMIDALINSLTDFIYIKDRNSRFMRINKSQAKLLGLDHPDQVIGKTDTDFYSVQHATEGYADEQYIISNGLPISKEEKLTRIGLPDKWVLTTKIPLKDSDGNITGSFGISRDITERKRNELESHVLYEITQGITSTSNLDELLKLIHKSLSKIVYADNCFVALYNHKTGLFSFPYFIDKYDAAPLPNSMGKSCTSYVFRTNKPYLFTQDEYNRLVDLNEVELVGSASPSWIGIPLHSQSGAIGVLVLQHYEEENIYNESDVRLLMSIGSQIAIAIERKQAEEEIKLKNELLVNLNAEKDKFFSILAHDLRGPMSAFVAATQILTEDIQNMTPEDIKDIIISMKTDATNVYKLLENLLEWSRLKRGSMEFNPIRLNLQKIINESVGDIAALARKKQIEIEVSVAGDIELSADAHMFQAVVRNLISNSVKFTPSGGKVTIKAVRKPEGMTEISVSDTGIGMTEEMKGKLFKMNEKTSRTGTEGELSTGLGLLLCKEFVEKHRGTIFVESEKGKGSTFCFTIPEL